MAQVDQKSCGSPILGRVEVQVGCDSEQRDLVEVESYSHMIPEVLSHPNHSINTTTVLLNSSKPIAYFYD